MHQNFVQLQMFNFKLEVVCYKVYWKIFIHGYLMYGISDDHERTMTMPVRMLVLEYLHKDALSYSSSLNRNVMK